MKTTKASKPSHDFSTESPELVTKLKASDPDVQYYISELKTIIKNLHHQNLKLEAQNVSLDSRVNVLETEKKKGEWMQIEIVTPKSHHDNKPPEDKIK
jgi:hypothetical protein